MAPKTRPEHKHSLGLVEQKRDPVYLSKCLGLEHNYRKVDIEDEGQRGKKKLLRHCAP